MRERTNDVSDETSSSSFSPFSSSFFLRRGCYYVTVRKKRGVFGGGELSEVREEEGMHSLRRIEGVSPVFGVRVRDSLVVGALKRGQNEETGQIHQKKCIAGSGEESPSLLILNQIVVDFKVYTSVHFGFPPDFRNAAIYWIYFRVCWGVICYNLGLAVEK